jgi:hypothetical protein
MRVTLKIFSGRPNPSWFLTRSQSRELVDRLSATSAPVLADEPPVLGFRGFAVDATLDDFALQMPMPTRFVVPAPVTAPLDRGARKSRAGRAAAAAAAATKEQRAAWELSEWLVATGAHVLDPDSRAAVDAAMRERPVTDAGQASAEGKAGQPPALAAERVSQALAAAACDPFLTPMNAAFWDSPAIRFNNNCYNYASNFASNTMAQPGRRTGRHYTGFTCANVATAAQFDGFLPACTGTMRVVALGIWPGFDFHWWRLHPNGFWAHKIGSSTVLTYDNLGRVLGNGLTPENCDRGPYVQFCGFFFAPLRVQVL